jgi:uncharacterized protein
MAINPKTPGVYIQEISTLPPSVAPVATAVPGFVGYTEKGPANKPTRITSMLEFEQTFGGAFKESYTVNVNLTVTPNTVTSVTGTESNYRFYYAMQMYFGNGGGPCWVVSCGSYGTNTSAIDADAIKTGMDAFEQIDEVTLLLSPELSSATAGTIATTRNAMLSQCNLLQDRFCVFDAIHSGANTPVQDGTAFRATVGSNNLKYGAVYYPPLLSTLAFAYSSGAITISDGVSTIYDTPYANINFVNLGRGSYRTLEVNGALIATDTVVITVGTTTATLTPGTSFVIGGSDEDNAANIVAAINNHPVLSTIVFATIDTGDLDKLFIAAYGVGNIPVVTATASYAVSTLATAPVGSAVPNNLLYNSIKTALVNKTVTLNPSAAIAGIYASVDRDRGVWKAPANVSVNMVSAPLVTMTDDDQGTLNVDATSGKSINAIRPFTGKGNLVWGARTLAGNDNEWRYVNVRRLFIYAEESIKKATEFVVFEPNDRNTWSRVKGTISNFLTNLWRDGGLVGATPEQAFFVHIGLGETMTAQDILEGKLIVRVGMAASRPAEFIILQFQHKLQEG